MTQSQIEEILYDLSYQRMSDEDLLSFFQQLTSVAMYRKVTITYEDMSFFLEDPNGILSNLIFNNTPVYISRLFTMANNFTDQEIYNIFSVLNSKYGTAIRDLWYDVYVRFNLVSVNTGCLAYFSEKLSVLPLEILNQYLGIFTDALTNDEIDLDEIEKIAPVSIKEIKTIFFEGDFDPSNFEFHYPIYIRDMKDNKEYIDYIYNKPYTKIKNWTKMWPIGMYQEFLDAMPGKLEDYYHGVISLPVGSVISEEDFDYYKTFLNLSQITQEILTKEQIIDMASNLEPEDIIQSRELSLDEMSELGTFSLALYGTLLVESCLDSDEIENNVEAFSPELIKKSELFVTRSAWDNICTYHTDGELLEYPKTPTPSYFATAIRKKDFNLKYLEYLTQNLELSNKNILKLMINNPMHNKVLAKRANVLFRLDFD